MYLQTTQCLYEGVEKRGVKSNSASNVILAGFVDNNFILPRHPS